MFLQRSAGREQSFTINVLFVAFPSSGKTYLICGTNGIAAVQYPRDFALDSFFRPGMNERFTDRFRSNNSCDLIHARHIPPPNLIIIDEVLMLTRWVENGGVVTLQLVSVYDRMESGGKTIPFFSNLRQLPPVISNVSKPVVYRLITASCLGTQFQKINCDS
jgi:hypothetical protein